MREIVFYFSQHKLHMRRTLIALFTILSLSSCRPYAFLPESEGTPQLTQKKECHAGFNTLYGTNLQASYSPLQHCGILLNAYHMGIMDSALGFRYVNRYGGSISTGYYSLIDHLLIEFYAGAGAGKNKSYAPDASATYFKGRYYYSGNTYSSFFVIPSLSYFSEKFIIGFDCKISATQFLKNYNFRADQYRSRTDSALTTVIVNYNLPNRFLLAEPMLFLKSGGPKIKATFQVGIPFTPFDPFLNSKYRIFYPIIINLGIEYRIGLGKM